MKLQSGKNEITFQSNGNKIVGWLFCPPNLNATQKYPAISVAGPMGTVKEQAGGVFAEKLAEKGFITIVFDFRTQGESEGSPKNYENPFRKGEDIQNAINYLFTLECVDKDKVSTLGICAGGSYTMHGTVSDNRIKAFASVNPYFSMREYTGYNPLVTEEARNAMLKISNEDSQKYFETGVSDSVNMLMPEHKDLKNMPVPADDLEDISSYFYERVENEWPNYSSKSAGMSFESLIKSHALDLAKDLSIPYLGIVGENAITKPFTERFFAEILHENKEIKEIEEARHVQTYGKEEYVNQAVNHLSEFYQNI